VLFPAVLGAPPPPGGAADRCGWCTTRLLDVSAPNGSMCCVCVAASSWARLLRGDDEAVQDDIP
jgi:hypothetical protein